MIRRLVALSALVIAGLPAVSASASGDGIDPSGASVRVLDDDGVVTVAELATTKVAISPAPEDQRLEMEVGVAFQYFDGTDFSHGDTIWSNMLELRRSDPAQDFIVGIQSLGERPRSGLVRLEALLPSGQPVAHVVYSDPFTIDGAARGTVAATTDTVYPARDGYLDTTALTLTASEPVVYDLDVVAADGAVVRTFSSDTPRTEQRVTWWGTDPTGTPAAPGDYTARFTMTDTTGQVSTASRELSVRPERAVWTTWTRQLTPAQAHKGRPTIGFCSALRGNVNGWSGAHGFWSNNRCAGTDDYASRVKALYGSRIPTAGVVEYGDLSVIATGRADASRPRSIGYLSLDRYAKRNRPGTRVSSSYGQHSSSALPAEDVMDPDDAAIRWWFTVPYSHRWDVRRFTVKVQMRVLR